MPRVHAAITLRTEEAGGWRPIAGGALAWLVYAPGTPATGSAWLPTVPAPWPDEPAALLAHFGAAARGVQIATAAAVAWLADALEVAWVGDVRVLLVRDGAPVATTTDHSALRDLSRTDPDLARALPRDALLERITARDLSDGKPPERARWPTRPGDRVLLVSPELHDFRPASAWLAAALDPLAAPPGRLLLRTD